MGIRYPIVHWLGASFIFATLTGVAEIARLLVSYTDQSVAQGVFLSGLVLTILAVLLSHHLAIRCHEVFSSKVTRPWRVVQISDVHIGSRKRGFMQRIIRQINRLKPNYVVITGDLIDSSVVDIDALQSIDQLTAPVLYTIGNHERYADLEKILDIASRLGMKTLRQESVTDAEISFIGIDDSDHYNQVQKHLPTILRDNKKFNILLYHRPNGWESAIRHDIDLMLCGHTHNGQVFPFNLIVKQQFEYISGMYCDRQYHLYVSPGTGTWGPSMRLGSFNEISVFDIKPDGNKIGSTHSNRGRAENLTVERQLEVNERLTLLTDNELSDRYLR